MAKLKNRVCTGPGTAVRRTARVRFFPHLDLTTATELCALPARSSARCERSFAHVCKTPSGGLGFCSSCESPLTKKPRDNEPGTNTSRCWGVNGPSVVVELIPALPLVARFYHPMTPAQSFAWLLLRWIFLPGDD